MADHPKWVGDRTTIAVIAAFQLAGYGVYLPLGENTRCDLVVEQDSKLTRVQCKTGRLRNGVVSFAVCSTYGHHRNPLATRRTYHGEIDVFGVYCLDTSTVYVVPIQDAPGGSRASLRINPPRNNQRRRIRLAADYELARVAIAGLRAPSGA